jgi:hypothetical protein
MIYQITEAQRQQCMEALERYQVQRQEFERFADVLATLQALTPVSDEPVAWAIFLDDGTAHMWSKLQPHVQKLADAEGLTVTPLYTRTVIKS